MILCAMGSRLGGIEIPACGCCGAALISEKSEYAKLSTLICCCNDLVIDFGGDALNWGETLRELLCRACEMDAKSA